MITSEERQREKGKKVGNEKWPHQAAPQCLQIAFTFSPYYAFPISAFVRFSVERA
jgi:hypothetical protein